MYEYSILTTLTAEDEKSIESFLQMNEGVYYFQSPAFFYICIESKELTPYYVIAKSNSKIIGTLLIFKQEFINIPLISPFLARSVSIGGPISRNKDVVNGLLERSRKIKSLYTQIRNSGNTIDYIEEFCRNKFKYEGHLNFIVDLRNSEADLWKNIHTKRRNEIRRAEKEGSTVTIQNTPEALRSCYAILKEVYQRARLPLPDFSHFKALLAHANAESGLRLFTVMWNEKIIGCMFCLAYGNTLYDYYAGAYSQYYNKYPNDLLPWEVMKWGQKNGFTYFDFGGAGKPNVPYGVRDYKKKFGGALVNYGRYERIEFPVVYSIAQLAFNLIRGKKKAPSLT
ncbi:hypothetical protein GCM10028807_28040 [Spirosoma daeguense]